MVEHPESTNYNILGIALLNTIRWHRNYDCEKSNGAKELLNGQTKAWSDIIHPHPISTIQSLRAMRPPRHQQFHRLNTHSDIGRNFQDAQGKVNTLNKESSRPRLSRIGSTSETIKH